LKQLIKCDVYLGLNEKESIMLAGRFGFTNNDIIKASDYLYEKLSINIIVHGIGYSYYTGKNGNIPAKGKIAENPLILTGAGDCFGASFCSAVMRGNDIHNAMCFANDEVYKFVTGK